MPSDPPGPSFMPSTPTMPHPPRFRCTTGLQNVKEDEPFLRIEAVDLDGDCPSLPQNIPLPTLMHTPGEFVWFAVLDVRLQLAFVHAMNPELQIVPACLSLIAATRSLPLLLLPVECAPRSLPGPDPALHVICEDPRKGLHFFFPDRSIIAVFSVITGI